MSSPFFLATEQFLLKIFYHVFTKFLRKLFTENLQKIHIVSWVAHNQRELFRKEIDMAEGISDSLPYKLECTNHKGMVSNLQNIQVEQEDRIDVPQVQIP